MNSERHSGCGCLLAVAFLLGMVLWAGLYLASAQRITATLQKTVVDRGNTYFVIRQDGHAETEILENEDSPLFFKFNSGSILMNLEVGKHYSFKVAGWRVPLFSWYRNIISYQEATQ